MSPQAPENGRKARGRRHVPDRDQAPTAFTAILAQLVDNVPGARAAALVDVEGETVDYAGVLPPFDVKVAAAQWRVVIDELRLRAPLEQTTLLTLRAAHASYQVHVLPEGYALVLILSRAAGFGGWRRAVTACCIALAEEASWSWNGRVPSPRWYVARVSTDARRRPATLLSGGSMRALEVLGAVASGMAPRERGWRVRLETGVEATLVREPGGGWYVDDPGALAARGPPRRIKSR